ncbi:MAG: cytochrome c maturation protein CcmE [Rhodospirillales bacterium]|nr:cytochrome c maturation protein CcmE [Rhodospirillales bacterium]
MKRKHQRLILVSVGFLALCGAAALVLLSFEENLVFFYSPTDLINNKEITSSQRIRIGGLVENGSVKKTLGGSHMLFTVTDLTNKVIVRFDGILPDLFREGQGVLAEGNYRNGRFFASEVLAKHDETYMPKEVADAIKKSGKWKGVKKVIPKKPRGNGMIK